MSDRLSNAPVATLWRLVHDGDQLSCNVYRNPGGDYLLQVEGPGAVIVSERFDLQPRMLARTQTLRESLKRRGWHDPAE